VVIGKPKDRGRRSNPAGPPPPTWRGCLRRHRWASSPPGPRGWYPATAREATAHPTRHRVPSSKAQHG